MSLSLGPKATVTGVVTSGCDFPAARAGFANRIKWKPRPAAEPVGHRARSDSPLCKLGGMEEASWGRQQVLEPKTFLSHGWKFPPHPGMGSRTFNVSGKMVGDGSSPDRSELLGACLSVPGGSPFPQGEHGGPQSLASIIPTFLTSSVLSQHPLRTFPASFMPPGHPLHLPSGRCSFPASSMHLPGSLGTSLGCALLLLVPASPQEQGSPVPADVRSPHGPHVQWKKVESG